MPVTKLWECKPVLLGTMIPSCVQQRPSVNLSKAKLCRATLQAAQYQNFVRTDLSEANLQEADLTGTILAHTNLKGATMPEGSIHD